MKQEQENIFKRKKKKKNLQIWKYSSRNFLTTIENLKDIYPIE